MKELDKKPGEGHPQEEVHPQEEGQHLHQLHQMEGEGGEDQRQQHLAGGGDMSCAISRQIRMPGSRSPLH
jgi:hypothetical protein